jgi:hypothetical protein
MEGDASHDLDLTVLFRSSNHDAEMEATAIHGLLESNGISSVLVGSAQIPSLEFIVEVPRAQLEAARQVIAEATAAGPEAALEAERNEESSSEA